MAANNKAPVIANPELLDRIIGNIQTGLVDNLPWLDKAFGRAERLVKYDGNRKRYFTPCVYVGRNDYIEVTPDANIGNFCFFGVDDPQNISWEPGVDIGIKTAFSIIFWFDYRKIYNDASTRNKEDLKRQILDVLNGGFLVRNGSYRINKVYELAENIYRGFSLDEIENQFLMHPFGGFRFEGELSIGETCKL
jgi:hypothetical protein